MDTINNITNLPSNNNNNCNDNTINDSSNNICFKLIEKICNINLLSEIEKFTKIAILGGIIAFLSLTFNKKDLINGSNSIKNIYCLDIISSTLGIIVTFYFFMLSIKEYSFDEKNKVLVYSQKLNIITSFILLIIEILRFIDTIKVNNLRLFPKDNIDSNITNNNNNNNNDNNTILEDIVPEISMI